MNRSIARRVRGLEQKRKHGMGCRPRFGAAVLGVAIGLLGWAGMAQAQITIDKNGNIIGSSGKSAASVDRRFQQITPTKIDLAQQPLNEKTRLELERFLEADQGFAMRPFPRGHKGLTLVANGEMSPAGEDYLSMVTTNGLCAKPGDRLVLSDVKIDKKNIVFQINGGPDAKHRFLRHIEIGAGPMTSPVVQDDPQGGPMGARLTLTFPHGVPEMTGKQVESLLAPLIAFEVKTPIQAFTDTLPPQLKAAILDHHVLVGMSTDMVLFAMGRPERKMREMEGQMPVEIWIYGKPPQDVDFVRINGNRVIRVEIAAVGKPVQVFEKDEVEGLMRTDGTALEPETTAHNVQMGDVQRDPDKQAPAAPPSLRNPGEQLPVDTNKDSRVGVMKPVHFPTQKPDDTDSTDGVTAGTVKPDAGKTEGNAQPGQATQGSQQPDGSKQTVQDKTAPDKSAQNKPSQQPAQSQDQDQPQ
ncbi:MAG TPA: hypothetical protein VKR52_01465 [Terracidiphilus sp.]|nr:hypothetical protein [Terracidiphilus sp.]